MVSGFFLILATLLPLLVGVLAGVLGAILGLGGGVIVVPALEFIMQALGQPISLTEAVAVSQVGVLAVGLSGAAAYMQRGLVQLRLGYLLAPFTILGGVLGSFLGLVLPAVAVATVFVMLLLYSAYKLLRPLAPRQSQAAISPYTRPAMAFAGIMSGLLGIGGGTVQVPVLHLLAGLPMHQAVATSTFMMGLTATANIIIYQSSGMLNAQLALAVALGVLLGAKLGANLQQRVSSERLKQLFAGLLLFTAAQFFWKYWLAGLFTS